MAYFKTILLCTRKQFSLCNRNYSRKKDPMNKTWSVISNELPSLFGKNNKNKFYPENADVVVIGGGLLGSSVAYWLKTMAGRGLSVVVLEKDFTFQETSQSWSSGGINQHFSLPENIMLSQYSAEFLRNVKEHLEADVDIQYSPHGSLVLAGEKYADMLEQNVTIQKEFGVRNELLSPEKIKERYSWINVSDVKLGCISSESDGWFNSWNLLKSLIFKSSNLGVTYVNAEVTGFDVQKQKDVLMEGVSPGSYKRINKVKYKTSDGEDFEIKFAICVLAAGVDSRKIASMAGIGTGDGLLKIPLPIEPRKFRVYCIKSNHNNQPNANMPLLKDMSGMWIRGNRLHNDFLCGYHPFILRDNDDENMSDETYFNNLILPSLSNRIPSLNIQKENIEAKVEISDCNIYDESGIIGPHPYYNNFVIVSGFGNQGIQHAPGIGRATAEFIIDSNFTTIDLTRFGFDRILVDRPMIEINSY